MIFVYETRRFVFVVLFCPSITHPPPHTHTRPAEQTALKRLPSQTGREKQIERKASEAETTAEKGVCAVDRCQGVCQPASCQARVCVLAWLSPDAAGPFVALVNAPSRALLFHFLVILNMWPVFFFLFCPLRP
jgi:hypothetical protein